MITHSRASDSLENLTNASAGVVINARDTIISARRNATKRNNNFGETGDRARVCAREKSEIHFPSARPANASRSIRLAAYNREAGSRYIGWWMNNFQGLVIGAFADEEMHPQREEGGSERVSRFPAER